MSVSNATNAGFTWKCLLFSKQQIKLSLKIAVIVGTVLNIINQGHLLLTPEKINFLKIILTYCVPYGVSTFSAAMSNLKHQRESENRRSIEKTNHAQFVKDIVFYLDKINTKSANDPNLYPKDFAEFLREFEAVHLLNSQQSIDLLDSAKDAINAGDLPIAFSIIKEIVEPFAEKNSQKLIDNEGEAVVLREQRKRLLNALLVLSKEQQ